MNFFGKVWQRILLQGKNPDPVEELLNQIFELTDQGIQDINGNQFGSAAIKFQAILDARNELWQLYDEAKNEV
jgi:hypothetical protein